MTLSNLYASSLAFLPIVVGTGLSIVLSMIVSVFSGVRCYEITEDGKKMDTLLDNVVNYGYNSNIIFANNKMIPSGWVLGFLPYPYIGHIVFEKKEECATSQKAIIWTTRKVFMSMLKFKAKSDESSEHAKCTEDDESKKEPKEIEMFTRQGPYQWIEYVSRQLLGLEKYVPREGQQQNTVDSIVKLHKERQTKRRGTTVFVTGEPGSGKSSLAMLCALATNGMFCETFSPNEPGDNLEKLVRIAMPRREKPLIIILDEVDVLLNKVHHNSIQKEYKGIQVPISVKDKRTWNSFLDTIDRVGMYENVILIMTSNMPKNYIDLLDPSYLRDGRIHGSFVV